MIDDITSCVREREHSSSTQVSSLKQTARLLVQSTLGNSRFIEIQQAAPLQAGGSSNHQVGSNRLYATSIMLSEHDAVGA
jgi:hypothetical protein